ncbi:hypothetical protein [Myroides odoratus]|uniref:Uncharacterized protein n=1 Tax=Myroides odoratus TaxID=256 RepID=A0A9Q6ZI74_MYROD|nr:hypothetical protein [Myroides odoratus]EHQ43475.1 hypothetical protein Myrod_2654 [Myroides odoratus DSM 2801]EKB06142.1 hypothetical protein HMPREF9716_02518 [Myroides odoratus CIP 103059]QQU00809.1 hypothetical protein I6I88_03310 [Myroides odoratus]WQD56949.1 hypothetical protein U0010_15715 [Myroides odoratus]STZ30754.1 Uncharacterised protein [Myroides odoratus]
MEKLRIEEKFDNAVKQKLIDKELIASEETIGSAEFNALVAKTNELVTILNNTKTVPQEIEEIIGTDALHLFIDSSAGESISADYMQTTLTVTVERYFNNYSAEVVSWQWFRESGDTLEDRDSDAIWSQGKTEPVLHLTAEDFTANIHTRPIVFICQAMVHNQRLTAQTNIG